MVAILLGIGSIAGGCGSTSESAADPPREIVVLIHGMGRSALSMSPLSRALKRAGFDTRKWSYWSFAGDIQQHADRLRAELSRLDQDPDVNRFHLVGHSLGGIVARAALVSEIPDKLGRVVMLAPPNRGSKMASRFAPWLGGLVGPLKDLTEDPESAVNRLARPEGVEIGIIAGSWDSKVPVESTHLEGETDHLVVRGFHTFLMNQTQVQDQVVYFLRNGRFNR